MATILLKLQTKGDRCHTHFPRTPAGPLLVHEPTETHPPEIYSVIHTLSSNASYLFLSFSAGSSPSPLPSFRSSTLLTFLQHVRYLPREEPTIPRSRNRSSRLLKDLSLPDYLPTENDKIAHLWSSNRTKKGTPRKRRGVSQLDRSRHPVRFRHTAAQ